MPNDTRLSALAYSRGLSALRTNYPSEYKIQVDFNVAIRKMHPDEAKRAATRWLRDAHRSWFDSKRKEIYQELVNGVSDAELNEVLESIQAANVQRSKPKVSNDEVIVGHPDVHMRPMTTLRDYLDRYLEANELEFKNEPGLMDEILDPDGRLDLEDMIIEKLMIAVAMCHHLGIATEDLLERRFGLVEVPA